MALVVLSVLLVVVRVVVFVLVLVLVLVVVRALVVVRDSVYRTRMRMTARAGVASESHIQTGAANPC
jgi:hypothetical protein